MTNFGNLNIDSCCGAFRAHNLNPAAYRPPLNLLTEVACAAR